MKILIAIVLMFIVAPVRAGELAQLVWLAGHWVSSDGAAEEVWLEPRGGTMAGSFRWIFPGGRQVLEYLVIEENDAGITLRFKHYNTDFVPWEKGEPNAYRLRTVSANRVSFDRISANDRVPAAMSYTRDGDTLRFVGEGEPGEEPLELTFNLRR